MTVGQPIARIEGPAKVTGRARYAADNRPDALLYGVLVTSPVASGTIRRIDVAKALRIPGVVRVLTRVDMPKFGKVELPAAITRLPLQSDKVEFEGEAVAIVLAESLEEAEEGAQAVMVEIDSSAPVVPGHGKQVRAPADMMSPELRKGDLAAELAGARTRHSAVYSQTARHHNPMETSATVAQWRDGKLTLWDAVQHAENLLLVLPAALGVKREDIHVLAPHTGGGFGSKGYVWPHQVLTAAAARIMDRPVKLQLSRAQMYAMCGHQPIMRQEMELGCDAEGHLTALRHDNLNMAPMSDTFYEPATAISRSLYAVPAIWTTERIERANISLGTPMRAPVEGPGSWALESAMDELAKAAGIDPLDLRLASHADVHPENGKPWSSKKLKEAYERGAQLYGWRQRSQRPKADGPWRIGHGMATCTMGTFRFPGEARVRLMPDGRAVVEANTHDIGTGTQTIFCQVAAKELGLPIEQVSIRWGDSQLPKAGPVYGSSATMSTGGAVALAARDAKAQLARLVGTSPDTLDIGAALRKAGQEVTGQGKFTVPGGDFSLDGNDTPHAMKTWGAIFLEVAVDPDFGVMRLRRAVGVYSAGRIINPRSARSQMIGGLIWGWGMATMEGTEFEPSHARWLAKNLSNVMLPVNADIPSDITIEFIDEHDPYASPIGARGIGELAATGIAAAVGAAVHDAVGVRVRDLPITPAKVLAGLHQPDPSGIKS